MFGEFQNDIIEILLLSQYSIDQGFDQPSVDIGQFFRRTVEEEIDRVMGGGPQAQNFDGSGAVGGPDLASLLSAWGT